MNKQNAMSKQRIISPKILILILFITIISIIGITSCEPKPTTQKKANIEEDKKLTAYVFSQLEIERYLKSPSTAEFPRFSSVTIYKDGSDYVVNSYVDSQNSFGGIVRTLFSCVVSNPISGSGSCQAIGCAIE